jgi:hypothetical protein
MADEFATVSVWLGVFASEKHAEAYFEETYDDELPISQFAREQGQRFYDHDFVERSFHERTNAVGSLLRGHSFSSSFGTSVTERARERAVPPANTVVLVWNHEVQHPRSVRGSDYSLEFLGTFPCDPNAPPL